MNFLPTELSSAFSWKFLSFLTFETTCMLHFLNRSLVRRTVCGGFLFLILLNVAGYTFALELCRADIGKKAAELIETHASEISGNLIFRMPVGDTYAITPDEYTPLEGTIEFEDVTYRLVKQKLHDKLLYVVCVKDDQTSIATEEINEIIAAVSGQPTSSSTTGVKVLNTLMKYCMSSALGNEFASAGWSREVFFGGPDATYFQDTQHSLFHPPAFC